jgi:apolipoprotein D and lipocalin family protein
MLTRICSAAVVAVVALAGCQSPPVNRSPAPPLVSVASVDLQRYTGRWYELARFPNSFEEDCVGVTATYSKNADGTIKVLNRCLLKTLDGNESVAEGSARVVDTSTNAKLAVSFFWPFEGDYWVIALEPEYKWAIVGEPSGRYLWILSRTPQVPEDVKADLLSRVEALGYNTKALYWTPQQ